MICGLLEVSEHIHDGSCFAVTYEQSTEPVLVCGLEVHEHSETCLPEEETADSALISGAYCGLAEHEHVDACYSADGALMCTMAEHAHEELCWLAPADTSAVETEEEWLADLPELTYDNAADLIAVAESQLGYAESDVNYIVTEDGEILYYSRYAAWWSYGAEPYGDWNAKFVAFCLENAGIPSTVVPVEPETATWPSVLKLSYYDQWRDNDGTFAPIAADLVFFDTDNDGTADRAGIITAVDTENSTISVILERRGLVQQVNYDLDDDDILGYARIPGNEPAVVEPNLTEAAQNVIDQIDALPTYDEYVAQLDAYYEADDLEGEEAYATAVFQQFNAAQGAYILLSPEEQAAVYNIDKLMALDGLWQAETLAITTARPTIYQINSYVNSSSGAAVMVFGGTVAEKVTYKFLDWYAIKVEKDSSGYLRVIEILQPGVDKSNYRANDTGFVLLFYKYEVIPDAVVGNYVTVHFTIPASGALKSEGYGTVSFSTSPSGIHSAEPTKIDSASTSEFVELNLYDYNGAINSNYWNEAKDYWYPGFQWNGGAYKKYGETNTAADLGIPDYNADRNYVDSIDFGNSLITNLTYGDGTTYTKAVNATNVAKTSANYSGSSPINWIYGNDTEGYTNKPIGTSTTDISYTDVMYDTLIDGYPAMSDETMLDYLFKEGTAVDKLNTESIDGLFLYDAESGAYTFNSREHHAEYVTGENRFQLYDEIITPNFLLYPFGNFLPLNTIDDSSKATQVSAFNYSGGMRNYVERLIADLKNDAEGLGSYWNATQRQLATMLEEYKENWSLYGRTINDVWNTWENLSAANAIRDFFWKDNANSGDGPTDDTDFITGDHLSQMYNIDWDVQTNFFFGMEMKMKFYQPKDGMTGTDKDGDGNFDYPMEFNFTGDDDVWVYIDDVLFLDLSGIHRHVGGQIDFVNGKVHYYALDTATGDVSTTPYKTFTFAEILTAAGKSTDVLNSKGTFTDYSTHSFNFYYMERGSGSSVCRLNFNFPLLRQNTLSVGKELTADSDSIEAIGNPDFLFQVLDADDHSLFLPDGWAYSLYDVDGSLLQEIVVNSKYPDGRVKEMVIKDATGNTLCTETYNADGTLKSRTGSAPDKVLRTDANGIFKLKAGQRAEFVGIPETWGKYYVRELLDNLDLSQYESVTVSGEATTKNANLTIGGTTFTGLESPVLDMTNGSSIFRFNNKIDTLKFGSLKITKTLVVGDPPVSTLAATPTTPEFTFSVTLDGVPLPKGTAYTVTGETTPRTVTEAGYITIPAGQTATISHILSGSRFEVTEIGATEAGYTVKYAVDDVVSTTGSATGVIRQQSQVAVDITNYTGVESVQIPIIKNLSMAHATEDLTFQFDLVQVTDRSGTTVADSPTTNSITVTLERGTTQNSDNRFALTYDGIETTKLPVVYYYKITEAKGHTKNVVYDPSVYVVEVSITASDGAQVTGVWKDGAAVNNLSVAFTNTIIPTGDLKLEKQVKGTADLSGEFSFNITLKDKDGNPITGTFDATFYQRDGTVQPTVLTASSEGIIGLTSFMHGEAAVIHDIPIGTKWTITETSYDGFAPTYTVTQGEITTEGTGTVSEGEISAGETVVVYTNTALYALPETGGDGVARFLVCGGVLMAFPLLLLGLGRRRRHRGRRVQGG